MRFSVAKNAQGMPERRSGLRAHERIPGQFQFLPHRRPARPHHCRMKSPLKEKIVQSGIIYTLLSFVTGGCNFYFQRILSSALDGDNGEYGAFKTTTVFVTLLGLPLSVTPVRLPLAS